MDAASRTPTHAREEARLSCVVLAAGRGTRFGADKMLHPVLIQLKHQGAEGDPEALVDALITLFDIDPSEFEETKPRQPEREEEDANVVPFRQKDSG